MEGMVVFSLIAPNQRDTSHWRPDHDVRPSGVRASDRAKVGGSRARTTTEVRLVHLCSRSVLLIHLVELARAFGVGPCENAVEVELGRALRHRRVPILKTGVGEELWAICTLGFLFFDKRKVGPQRARMLHTGGGRACSAVSAIHNSPRLKALTTQ